MTNKSIRSKNNKPFLLKPASKDYLWGGNRLNDDFSKNINLSPLAETWECSTHPDGLSFVGSGKFAGKTLKEVLECHPEFIGEHFSFLKDIPILVKFIDAKEDLSIQVHPSDEFAFKNEQGKNGKTEMWYVLDAFSNSKLVYGFHKKMTQEEVLNSIKNESLEKYLQYIKVHPNDVFFIEPGTVHAIGAGVLLAEIQQNSNLTYRLYDYNRLDKNGKKRDLHIEKALKVADLSGMKAAGQPMRVLNYVPGCASEVLGRCKYFQVDRMILNTERNRQMVEYQSDSLSFRVLLCIAGCGSMLFGDESLLFFKGDCIFVPANSLPIKIHGKCEFLSIKC